MVQATKQAQTTTVCPLCGAVPWKEGLLPLKLSPANHVLLGEIQLVYLCPACLAQLSAVPENERWLCYLELVYKRHLEQAVPVKVKKDNHGHKGRKR
jgi:hypothetical protein